MSNLYIDNDFKLDEINTPIKPYIKNMNSPISSTIFKNFFREISEVRINTDTDLIFSSFDEIKSYKFSGIRESIFNKLNIKVIQKENN